MFCDHAYIYLRIRVRTYIYTYVRRVHAKTSNVQSIDHDPTYIILFIYIRNQLIDQIENLPMCAESAHGSQ